MNNSSLTFYNYSDSTVQTDYFDLQNARKLGDTGNDIKVYGSKLYIVVNISSQLEVLNKYTCKSIQQIHLFNNNKPRQPRYITFNASKAFVCCFDGTVAVIDTTTLNIEKYITVGRNPDGIAVANNKVYVSNSGGLDNPNYDNTISVIDITTMEEIKKITVRINPHHIIPDQYGNLFVISRGNYSDIKMCLQIIDSKNDQLTKTFDNFQAMNLAINGDIAYVYYYDYVGSSGSSIMTLNIKTQQVISNNFITDGTAIQTIYGIAVDKQTGDVYISDAKAFMNKGTVFCFNSSGKKKFSFPAGLNPSTFAFVVK